MLFIIGASEAFAKDCKQGMVFNSKLNRCVLSSDTVENKSKAQDCSKFTGDEFKECFHKNVDDEMKDAKAEGKVKDSKDPKARYTVASIMTIMSGIALYQRMSNSPDKSSTSMMLAVGAGAGTILGELLAQNSYRKKVRNLKDKYTKRMKDSKTQEGDEAIIDSVSENQKIAFDFQIEQEEARKKAHKTRKTVYMVAGGLYAASSITAMLEAKTGVVGINSIPTQYLPQELYSHVFYLDTISVEQFSDLVSRKIYSIFMPQAFAGENSLENLTAVGLIGASAVGHFKFGSVMKPFENKWSRAAITGLLSGYSLKVASDAKDHQKKSEKRIKVLKELKKSFVANGGAGFSTCSKEDRDDKTKPGCFCYGVNGERKVERAGDKICKELFAQDTRNFATNYQTARNDSNIENKACFTEDKKFDAGCACKKKPSKSNKKKNSCLKFSGKFSLGGLSKLKGTKGLISDNINFNRGNISAAELEGSAKNVNGIVGKINDQKKKLAKDPKFAKDLKKIGALERKLNRGFASQVRQGINNGSISPSNLGFGDSSTTPTSKEDVLKDFKNDIEEIKPQFKKSGSPLARKGKKRNINDFDFDSSSDGVDIDQLDKVMKKEYTFNDINDNSSNNLFKIITNRYQRSGLRRLFDDQGVSEADEASDTDINEK